MIAKGVKGSNLAVLYAHGLQSGVVKKRSEIIELEMDRLMVEQGKEYGQARRIAEKNLFSWERKWRNQRWRTKQGIVRDITVYEV